MATPSPRVWGQGSEDSLGVPGFPGSGSPENEKGWEQPITESSGHGSGGGPLELGRRQGLGTLTV